jgi:hypothetical protein
VYVWGGGRERERGGRSVKGGEKGGRREGEGREGRGKGREKGGRREGEGRERRGIGIQNDGDLFTFSSLRELVLVKERSKIVCVGGGRGEGREVEAREKGDEEGERKEERWG